MSRSGRRGTLFLKYAGYFCGLVSVALLASGGTGLYFAYRDTRTLVEELQREKARGAALQIQQFVSTIEGQVRAALLSHQGASLTDLEEQHFELLRLLRQAPAVIDAAWIDGAGIQQVKASRISRDELRAGRSLAEHPGVLAALRGESYLSSVYFRQQSEPYMTIATGSGRREDGVTLAEVNLKFVWEVVSAIKVGTTGYAYVVDSAGRLISHPDISLVLRGTDLSAFAPVREALSGRGERTGEISLSPVSPNRGPRRTLTVPARIPKLDWHVLVEQPLAEAFEPLYASAARTALLFLAGIALATLASVLLARRMTAPIHLLQKGVTRFGDGKLDERVEVRTGDELESLADQFNQMAGRLRESHIGMEQKIEERTRQLAAANRAKSLFLAAASHDLRQPVHALGLYVAQLRDTMTDVERDRILGKIELSTAAVSELLAALLDISKLDAGAVIPRPAEFPIQPLLTRLEANFAISAQDKGVQLRIRRSRCRVTTDPMLLERILMNLAANAVRYTRRGGVLIGCRQRGGKLRIEVWDTGIGIALGQRRLIFEEFYQGHEMAPESGKGLGLGLAIVDRLVQLLGLDIELSSTEGRGSMFAVLVPLAKGPAPAPQVFGGEYAQMRFDGALALLVDDDADAREAAAGLLEQWGWRVTSCRSGFDALEALGNTSAPLDVIISALRLPRGELGSEVIDRVRTVCGREVPAIVVSGDSSVVTEDLGRSGNLHLLYKPLKAAKLRTLLHHLLWVDETTDASRPEL